MRNITKLGLGAVWATVAALVISACGKSPTAATPVTPGLSLNPSTVSLPATTAATLTAPGPLQSCTFPGGTPQVNGSQVMVTAATVGGSFPVSCQEMDGTAVSGSVTVTGPFPFTIDYDPPSSGSGPGFPGMTWGAVNSFNGIVAHQGCDPAFDAVTNPSDPSCMRWIGPDDHWQFTLSLMPGTYGIIPTDLPLQNTLDVSLYFTAISADGARTPLQGGLLSANAPNGKIAKMTVDASGAVK